MIPAEVDWMDVFAGRKAMHDTEIMSMVCGCGIPISAFTPILSFEGGRAQVESLVCIQCKQVFPLVDGRPDMDRCDP